MKRIAWIDNAKAIGIIFVVLGHATSTSSTNPAIKALNTYIYSFHMPLFFFLSGCLYKSMDFKTFIRRRFKSLIVPYFIYAFLTALLMNRLDYRALIGTLYSNNINGWLDYNVPLWFLTCLLVTELFFFFIERYTKQYLALALFVCALIGSLIMPLISLRFPWSINSMFSAVAFYGAGYLFRKHHRQVPYELIPVLLVVNYVISTLNGRVSIGINLYGNVLFYFLSAFSGIFAYILIAHIFNNKFIAFIGRNTLIILALHMPILGYLKQSFGHNNSLPWLFLYTAITIIGLTAIIKAINFILLRYKSLFHPKSHKQDLRQL